jgi:hypothetical protein
LIQNAVRKIRAAQVAVGASGFNMPNSWIIANPLDAFMGGRWNACSVTEIVESAPAENAALEKVIGRIEVALVKLKGKVAGSPPPPAKKAQAEGNGGDGSGLGERSLLVLKVLLNGKAFDSDHRMRTADIAKRAAGKTADPNQYKEVVADLKGRGYVDTKEGRTGGCWLTAAGRSRAEKL